MEIKTGKYGMMTLVSMAVLAGYLFSALSTFWSELDVEFYLEISTLIWVLLFGHYLEAKSGKAAGNALDEIAKLLPKKAHLLENGKEREISIEELKKNDIVLVKVGEKVPADGIILKGKGFFDESLISGESKPVSKKEGYEVVAGSVLLNSAITLKIRRVGEHSTVGQIKNLIRKAQMTKPRSQQIADRAAAILTFVAGATAILTLLIWTIIVGKPLVFGLTLAITVLVIACPHALGLAIPTVTTIATKLALKNGFFIKDLSKIESIRKASYVIFDKTGTLTEGKFGLNKIESYGKYSEREILKIAASLEKLSSHVLAGSIVERAEKEGIILEEVSEFKNIPGKGIEGKIDEKKYFLGKMNDNKENGDDIYTEIYLLSENEKIGKFSLSDRIKAESGASIERLHSMGLEVVMLTGDNERVAKNVAKELKIDRFFANVMPEDKYSYVKKMQKDGSIVIMVGDGVNDAPALTQADVGIAIGSGTDVAVESGDIVLMNNNPEDVAKLVLLSKKVYEKMIQNLIWALGYNIVAIPAAAGVFAFSGFFLKPEFGALIMSLSTVVVVVNALSLKRLKL